ncbi:NADP-dependent oxidoreductase [Rhodococcus triatomae]|uniref:Enoyl reductase (ER) domain-containing protein n=1 Tax=Rhodococcus triatomae TaxID=300028 RepID=A0A1G8DVD9_9NOCA|nr:NADP-dependent oxidoreductase [Rhodococcus triatomae]QNG18336.1 NADP-dependent oxidoreductase [Rhodococcus triatomae]QNG21994.1 NADP-dependent oxidoreductase [Rhodococcus triatomae]SDH61674.1 hypothetical protein SAMN05444695_102421 [Rhodococcus triatomae]
MSSHDLDTGHGQELRLVSRPTGEPRQENFELVSVELPQLSAGEVLVRNSWMSVDPYMRDRLDEAESYMPSFELGAALEGSAVGTVIASAAPEIVVGTTVSHFAGWRTRAVLDAAAVVPIDTAVARPEDHLGALGTTGLTAFVALTEIAPLREGDVVFVSAAAGAVGSVAGQLARRLGASKVIGSAGGPHKTKRLLDDFGFDAAIDYQAGELAADLAAAAPEGIDVYLDLVGGDHLDAAIDALRIGGRIALIGAIGKYDSEGAAPGPRDFFRAYAKRLTLRGMLVSDHLHRFPEYIGQASEWIADGTLRVEETVVEGLDQAPRALLDLFRGVNTGKMLVRL